MDVHLKICFSFLSFEFFTISICLFLISSLYIIILAVPLFSTLLMSCMLVFFLMPCSSQYIDVFISRTTFRKLGGCLVVLLLTTTVSRG